MLPANVALDTGSPGATTHRVIEPADVSDAQLRAAMFEHLDRLLQASPDGALASGTINTFTFRGRQARLIVQSGIWKPAGFSAALTIRTTFTPPNQPPPYADDVGEDGLVRYKYRGTDPNLSDNRALRTAMIESLPLAYFVGVARRVYVPRYPVWLVEEDPARHEFAIAVDEGQRFVDLSSLAPPQRAYLERLTSVRLHQPVFRARVLRAYGERCAMCRLHEAQLLMPPTSSLTANPRVAPWSRTGWRCARFTTLPTTST